jgi:hypothetical protein
VDEEVEQQTEQEEEKHVEEEEHMNEEEKEENTEAPGSTDTTKKEPKPKDGTDAHEMQSPSDDIQKASVMDTCKGLACRSGVLGTLLGLFLVFFVARRCLCASRKKTAMYHRAEVEMANGSGFSSYKDGNGGDDAEFGTLA